MSFPQDKLETYQNYYGVNLELVREFYNGTGHPVALLIQKWKNSEQGVQSCLCLQCACDFEWEWKEVPLGGKRQRALVHTRDGLNCAIKEEAREIIRNEIRAKYSALWSQLSLADVVYKIFQLVQAGEYVGEHNVGMLYVQDVATLLGRKPDEFDVHLGELNDANRKVEVPGQVGRVSFSTLLTAIEELKNRKLVTLDGMVLASYR